MADSFDIVIPRGNTDCFKYDGLLARYGRTDLLPFWVADMDFRSPECVQDALQRLVDHGIYGYPLKTDACYRAIGDWFERRHGYPVDPASILFTPGVITAVTCLVQSLSAPGDGIIIQPPVYHPFFSIIPASGRELLQNRLCETEAQYTFDYAGLEEQARRAKILLLCSPHNPVGRVWRREELERIAEICLRHRVFIIADEIHNDLVFPPHRHVPIASLSPDVEAITATCHAASKTFNLPGLFTAYAIIPNAEVRKAVKRFVEPLHVEAVNVFGLRAIEAAYTQGEPWLVDLLAYLQANFDWFRAELGRRLPRVKVAPLEGTYLAWLDFRSYGFSAEELKGRVQDRAHLALNDGPTFGPGGEGFQRMNLACPRSVLAEAVERLVPAFEEPNRT